MGNFTLFPKARFGNPKCPDLFLHYERCSIEARSVAAMLLHVVKGETRCNFSMRTCTRDYAPPAKNMEHDLVLSLSN